MVAPCGSDCLSLMTEGIEHLLCTHRSCASPTLENTSPFLKNLSIYLAALDLNCGTRDLCCVTWDLAKQPPDPLVGALGLHGSVACGILVPQPGIKPTASALQRGFCTTGQQEKSL